MNIDGGLRDHPPSGLLTSHLRRPKRLAAVATISILVLARPPLKTYLGPQPRSVGRKRYGRSDARVR
jgi:hypothetical protein